MPRVPAASDGAVVSVLSDARCTCGGSWAEHTLYAARERMPWCRHCDGRCMGYRPARGSPSVLQLLAIEMAEALEDVREGTGS